LAGLELDRATEVIHPFEPVWSAGSRVLILGTMPSQASRANGFYYGHPQNRFWKVLAILLRDNEPAGIIDKRDFLIRHHIALWDVLKSCQIEGSQDSTIRRAVPNDLSKLLRNAPIRRIFANGQTAGRIYQASCLPGTGIPCEILPSTSPANGRYSLAALCEAWQPVIIGLE
jgi:double-stranded uracil-DNA glycosylase